MPAHHHGTVLFSTSVRAGFGVISVGVYVY